MSSNIMQTCGGLTQIVGIGDNDLLKLRHRSFFNTDNPLLNSYSSSYSK